MHSTYIMVIWCSRIGLSSSQSVLKLFIDYGTIFIITMTYTMTWHFDGKMGSMYSSREHNYLFANITDTFETMQDDRMDQSMDSVRAKQTKREAI